VLVLSLAATGRVMIAGDLYHYRPERGSARAADNEFDVKQAVASRAKSRLICGGRKPRSDSARVRAYELKRRPMLVGAFTRARSRPQSMEVRSSSTRVEFS
jgi:hypothetical protein